jgi:CubicO group peptidase (beta-lactamase class C family)
MRCILIFALIGCAAERTPGTPPSPSENLPQPPVVGATPAEPPTYNWRAWPDPDWPTATPADVKLDVAGLDQAAAVAESHQSYCLLVIRHGALVYERYFNGSDATTAHKSWSLAKSYSGTLVGIALDRGDIRSLDDKVSDYVPEWKGTDREGVSVRDLVRMTSGLQWSAFQDYVQMATLAQDDTQFALGLPLSDPPGSKWVYHNGAVQILEPLFRGATGMTIEAYAQAHLWSKIGASASWAHDQAGNPTPYANVLTTCRDHARLGYLYLRRGHWVNDKVLSESFVAEALTPSQPYNRAYGLLFWLNGQTPAIDAMMEPWPGKMVPYAPDDLFAARGFGNQFIDVIPSLDMVVVRFGVDPLVNFDLAALAEDSRFTLHDQILQPILAALR